MKAIIYWTIPDKTFDVIGDPDQFSTGSSSVLCHVGPGYVWVRPAFTAARVPASFVIPWPILKD